MKVFHSLPDDERRRLVRELEGELVDVTYDARRDRATSKTVRGELVALVLPESGMPSAVIALRSSTGWTHGISLATVIALELSPEEVRADWLRKRLAGSLSPRSST